MDLILFLLLVCGALSLGLEPGRVAEVRRDCCRVCKYDLAGLNEDAVCPECGIDTPHTDFVTLPANVVIRWQALARAAGVMLVWVTIGTFWREIAGPLVAIRYIMKDVPLTSALWAVRQYELNSSRASDDAMWNCLWPLQLALLPMIATVRMPWKWYWRINPVLLGFGAALLVGRWVVAYV
ncbi:MAG: hypothetical protein WC718_09065 [Phycisphaerales bacterium]|jgi:hypothetical protein